MKIGIKTHILTHSSSLPERRAPGSEARWVNIILSHAPLKHSDGSLLKRTFCTIFKAVYEQSLTRSPWPRCDNGAKKKKILIYIWISVSVLWWNTWQRERARAQRWGLVWQVNPFQNFPVEHKAEGFRDTKVKRSAGKWIKFILLFGLFGEPDGPILSEQTLESPVRTCSVMSFSGLRRIGHWELFEAISRAIKEL